jgi:solute carrier family 25 carnitine/acylcarnitine transporter 20/29
MDNQTTRTIVGSTVAGLVSTILGHPLDTVKTHLQTNPKHREILHVVQTIRLGVFRGMGPPLANAIIMNTVMFSVFDLIQTSSGSPFAAGLISGVATAMISTPMDYLKIQAQLAPRSHGDSALYLLRYHQERHRSFGLLNALYRGHTVNLAREGIFTTIYLGIYHWIHQKEDAIGNVDKSTFQSKDLLSVALTSSMTGALAWVASYPCDTVKTMIQSGKTFQHVGKSWNSEGWKWFYRGCLASTSRAILVTSSRMVAYEWIVNVVTARES